jgi:hypothetical protein
MDLIQNYNIVYSLKIIVYGFLKYFDSPGNYPLLRNTTPPKIIDYFDLPDIETKMRTKQSNRAVFIPLSVYLFIYPIILLFLIKNFYNLSFNIRLLLFYLLYFSIIYIGVDPAEANRMRFEVEPIFYFLTIFSLRIIIFDIFNKRPLFSWKEIE